MRRARGKQTVRFVATEGVYVHHCNVIIERFNGEAVGLGRQRGSHTAEMYCNQSDLCGRDIIVGGWRIIMDNMDRNGVFAQSLLLPSIHFFLSSHSRYPENAR